MKNATGNLWVIAAPSGAGKTSLVKALSEGISHLQISVSHTTRPMRPAEVDERDYFFIDDALFNEMIEKKAFLEHAHVFGHQYGTSFEWVNQQLSRGVDVVLEIDWQGARQVRKLYPGSMLIFIVPPSMDALKERLLKRQQDNEQIIMQRMRAAQAEISHYSEFDYLVVNDQFEVALYDLKNIVLAARLKTTPQRVKQAVLLENLLKKQ